MNCFMDDKQTDTSGFTTLNPVHPTLSTNRFKHCTTHLTEHCIFNQYIIAHLKQYSIIVSLQAYPLVCNILPRETPFWNIARLLQLENLRETYSASCCTDIYQANSESEGRRPQCHQHTASPRLAQATRSVWLLPLPNSTIA